MKLAALHPRWFAEEGRHGQGLTFDCPGPCCIGKENAVRLAAAFANPLDGGAPINLASKYVFPALRPLPGEPNITTVPPGIHWVRFGETFETLALSPSIDASNAGHWHGVVANGEV